MRATVTFKDEDAAGHCIAERFYDAIQQSAIEGMAAGWAKQLAEKLKASGHRVCMVTVHAEVDCRAVLLMMPVQPEPVKTYTKGGKARKAARCGTGEGGDGCLLAPELQRGTQMGAAATRTTQGRHAGQAPGLHAGLLLGLRPSGMACGRRRETDAVGV